MNLDTNIFSNRLNWSKSSGEVVVSGKGRVRYKRKKSTCSRHKEEKKFLKKRFMFFLEKLETLSEVAGKSWQSRRNRSGGNCLKEKCLNRERKQHVEGEDLRLVEWVRTSLNGLEMLQERLKTFCCAKH